MSARERFAARAVEIRDASLAKLIVCYNSLRRHMRQTEFNSLDPRHLPPLDYAAMIRSTVNLNYRTDLIANFEGYKPTYGRNSLCIAATGSDGKMERHIQSKSEFIWLDNRPANAEIGITQEIRRFHAWYDAHNGVPFTEAYDAKPVLFEVKNLTTPESEAPLSYAYGNRGTVYPDRVLNAVVIFGNPNLLEEAKRRVYEEITADSQEGRHIREEMKKQLSASKKALETGISRGVACFDLGQKPPVQYYSEAKSEPGQQIVSTTGFKYPAMRAV